MRTPIVLVTLLALSLPAPSHADWQYARWGMTPAQVALAAKGAAPIGPGNPKNEISGYLIGNSGSQISGKYSFRTIFYYQMNKLAMIRLDTDSSDRCVSLKFDLLGVYGKPFNETHDAMDIFIWQDQKKNNRVTLMALNSYCLIQYDPLRSGGNSAL